MRLTKWGYYADFVLYPALVMALGLHVLWREPSKFSVNWTLAVLGGIVTWTFLEYLLHRVVLHHIQPFKGLHNLHHARPLDLIGTPSWISAALFFGLWLVLAHEIQPYLAGGVTAGLMLGYLGYVFMHHAVHKLQSRPGSWLFHAKVRHALHHHSPAPCNFGVSTGFWDTVFGSGQARRP